MHLLSSQVTKVRVDADQIGATLVDFAQTSNRTAARRIFHTLNGRIDTGRDAGGPDGQTLIRFAH